VENVVGIIATEKQAPAVGCNVEKKITTFALWIEKTLSLHYGKSLFGHFSFWWIF